MPAATRSVDASDTEGLLSNRRQVPAATRTSDVNNTVSQESVRVKEYLANLRKPTAQETLAAIADDLTKAEEQLSLSKKEQNFAKNLSQAAQNLNLVNAETKALGREYYTHSEEMPSLQDIQKYENLWVFIRSDAHPPGGPSLAPAWQFTLCRQSRIEHKGLQPLINPGVFRQTEAAITPPFAFRSHR